MDREKLVGKKVKWFGPGGMELGRVRKVVCGKRTGLRRLRVQLGGLSPKGELGYYGRVVTVEGPALRTLKAIVRGREVDV